MPLPFPRCVFIGDFYSFGTSLFQVTISGCFISWFVLHLCHPATHIVEHNVPIVSPFPTSPGPIKGKIKQILYLFDYFYSTQALSI